MERKNIYDNDVYREIRNRIDRLTPNSERQWGQMSASQMLAHCAEIQEVGNGGELRNTPFFVRLISGLIKRMVLSEKPYRKGMKTHPQYEIEDSRDFDEQKERLIAALEKTRSLGRTDSEHPLLGTMTPDERGWATYKHLDHHLRQFGE